MTKRSLLTKTLLVVAGLCVGASAWADTKNYAQVFKYTFEDAETYQAPWTISAGSASQFEISGDKYIYFKQSAANVAQTQTLDFSSSVTGIEDYLFSFDFAYCPMGYGQKGTDWTNKILTVYASDDSELFHLEADAASGAVDINVYNGSGTNIGKFTSGGRYADPIAANVYTITLTGDSENGVVIAIKNVSTSTAVTFSNSTLSASYKLATKIINTLQSTSNTTYYSRTIFDDVYFGQAVTGDYAEAPTFTMTGFDGTSRIFTISCNAEETIHYTVNGGATQDGASAGASVIVTVPAGQELVAWTTSGSATSTNTSYTVVGGTPVLTAPTVTLTDIGTGYSKTYTVSNLTQTISEGAYSYYFEPTSIFYATSASATSGTNIADNKFTLSAEGTYYVIVSATGATSANTKVDNTVKYILSANYDFTNAAILTSVWTDASGTEKWVNSGEAEAYKENAVTDASSTALFDGFTVSDAGSRLNKMHWHSGKGVQFVNSGGNFTIGLTTVPEDAIIRNTYYQDGSNKYVLGNTITIGRYNKTSEKQGLVAIDVYTPDPVAIAIADCKTYETSSAFATAVAVESFSTAAEVYAFHTAWQIERGTVTDGVRDITKVIRNAAVADATDWAGASTYTMPTKYPSAPDAVVLDAYNINSWATQTIYSLPAGVYTVTANTRGAADGYSHVYIYKSGVGDLATVATNTLGDGESAGTLGYGFSTVSATFTLTETSDLIFGFYAGLKETGKWASCDDWHLYKVESVSATVGANGYTTFASPYALDLTDANRPEGLKAYKATLTGSTLSFTKLNQTVPAGTGLLLLGETNGGTYNIPVVAGGDDVTNALVGVTSDTPLQSTVGGTYYFVMKKATTAEDDLAFAPISTTTAVTVPAGKTYVELDTSTGARSLTVAFDDEATGIKSVNGDGIMVNGFYNLNGQRVESPAKGLYIVNGKKVIMK